MISTEEQQSTRMENVQGMLLDLIQDRISKRLTVQQLLDKISETENNDYQKVLDDYTNYYEGLIDDQNKYLYKYVSNKIEKLCENV